MIIPVMRIVGMVVLDGFSLHLVVVITLYGVFEWISRHATSTSTPPCPQKKKAWTNEKKTRAFMILKGCLF